LTKSSSSFDFLLAPLQVVGLTLILNKAANPRA